MSDGLKSFVAAHLRRPGCLATAETKSRFASGPLPAHRVGRGTCFRFPELRRTLRHSPGGLLGLDLVCDLGESRRKPRRRWCSLSGRRKTTTIFFPSSLLAAAADAPPAALALRRRRLRRAAPGRQENGRNGLRRPLPEDRSPRERMASRKTEVA